MLTYYVSNKFANDYLKEIADYYLFMNVSVVDADNLRVEIDELDAATWHEKYSKKNLERTLVGLETAMMARIKRPVPTDLFPFIKLLVLYIAGAKHFLNNDQVGQAVENQAISNYIRAHRLFKEKSLDTIQIEIRNAFPAATFNNLSILYPLHEKVLKAIGEALMIGKESDLYKTLHNPNTTSKELKALELNYSTTLERLDKSVLANGALLLGRYLQEYAGFTNRGVSISDDQIRVVYNIYEKLDWVKAKSVYQKPDKPDAYIKTFRAFIRDNQTLS